MSVPQVIMYGADWCGDCIRSKRVLDELSVPYEYVNLVQTPEAADVAERISGRKNIPVVLMPDGSHLVEPTDSELRSSLESNGLL